jgi:hypothetical protein
MLTPEDLEYIRSQFSTLDALCAGRTESPASVRRQILDRSMPAATYVLDDGTEMFPPDYFALVDEAGGVAELRASFFERYARAAGPGTPDSEIAAEWDAYLSGAYGACLHRVSPETIFEKESLVKSLGARLAEPRIDDGEWRRCVRRDVSRLDELERAFAPCDRHRFGGSVSRDRLITAPRALYPDLFSEDR